MLRRRPEAYHRQIIEAAQHKHVEHLAAGSGPAEEADGHASELAKLLVYDDHERRSGLVRVLDERGTAIGEFDTGQWATEAVDGNALRVSRSAAGITVNKGFGVLGERTTGMLGTLVELTSDADFQGVLELEWNLNLLGGGANPAAFYRSDDREWRHDSAGAVEDCDFLSFGNRFEGAELTILATDSAASASWFPVETVSNSESGFEKVYQGSCLVQRWPLALAAGEMQAFTTNIRFTQTRDRDAEEVSA